MINLTPFQEIMGIILYGGMDLWCAYRALIMKRENDYEL